MKFLEFFKKPFIWCAIVSGTLAASTVFVLLDTFVLEEKYMVIDNEPVVPMNMESSVSLSTPAESSHYPSDFSSVSGTLNTTPTVTQGADSYADFDSYYDGAVRIKLAQIRKYETDIYLAEIVIADIGYLKSAFAENTFGRNIKETPSIMAEEHNAILAINGDFYGAHKSGYVFRNGTLYLSTIRYDSEEDDLLIYKDGSFGYINEETTMASTLAMSNVWHLLRFGPVLLDGGEITVNEGETTVDEDWGWKRTKRSNPLFLGEGKITVDEDRGRRRINKSNPRTAFGMFEPLHYLFVVADGRTEASAGLSFHELAEVMKETGVISAYNLDGGGSSAMYYNGVVVNNPTDGKKKGERRVSDIVFIG